MRRLGLRKPDAVYALVRSGQLPAYRIRTTPGARRGLYRFSEEDLAAYLAGVRVGAPAQRPSKAIGDKHCGLPDMIDTTRQLVPARRSGAK